MEVIQAVEVSWCFSALVAQPILFISAPLVRIKSRKMKPYKISLIGRFFSFMLLLVAAIGLCVYISRNAIGSRGPTAKSFSVYIIGDLGHR